MTESETLRAIPAATKSNGHTAESLPQSSKIELDATEGDLAVITNRTWIAIQAANYPPRFFRQSGIPVRIEEDDDSRPVIRELTAARLRLELAEIVSWIKKNDYGAYTVHPPTAVVESVLATANAPLPVLNRIVSAPIFGADGTLLTNPGYCEASRTWYAPVSGFVLPSVPQVPSNAEVAAARALIVAEMLADFPFSSEADRANAVGLAILPFVRDMIDGPTPLHDIESHTPGAGKGLLVSVLLLAGIGRGIGIITPPKDDDEWRKEITSRLREGHAAILIDNVNRPSTSGVLAGALTASMWSNRLLGRNETINLPVRCVWTMTANNPVLSTELARRTVRIRLDPEQDRPWLREGFKHPNLLAWAEEHRAEIVGALLTLVRHWIAQGKPAGSERLGSFEVWSEVIGGILETAGIAGFLANKLEFYEAADTEGNELRALVAAWWERYQSQAVKVAELFSIWNEVQGTEQAGDDKQKWDAKAASQFGKIE